MASEAHARLDLLDRAPTIEAAANVRLTDARATRAHSGQARRLAAVYWKLAVPYDEQLLAKPPHGVITC